MVWVMDRKDSYLIDVWKDWLDSLGTFSLSYERILLKFPILIFDAGQTCIFHLTFHSFILRHGLLLLPLSFYRLNNCDQKERA